MSPASSRRLGWEWAERCRAIGGNPTLEMFEEAVAAGQGAMPLMAMLLSRRSFREGDPPDCAQLPIHAARVLGEIREPGGIPALMSVIADPVDPGLHGEEAAIALGRVGEPALAPLEGVLSDRRRDTWIRAGAARGLMFCALADRRRRPRVLAAYESVLAEPRERDRVFVAHLVSDACLLAAGRLLPAIASAYSAGRVDEEIVDFESIEIDLYARHQRPDVETRELVLRDVREDYVSWDELVDGLEDAERARLERSLAKIERDGAEPPVEEDDEDEDSEPSEGVGDDGESAR